MTNLELGFIGLEGKVKDLLKRLESLERGIKRLSEQKRPVGRATTALGPHRGRIRKSRSRQIRLKYHIVCWNRDAQWCVGIVLEDIPEDSHISLEQNGLIWQPDGGDNILYEIQQFGFPISLSTDGASVEIFNGKIHDLIFVLDRDLEKAKASGSRILRTRKMYLRIVPDYWRRNTEVSGDPPITPEPTAVGGYKAHFFYIELGGNERIEFVEDSTRLTVQQELVEIFGDEIKEDVFEEQGKLFGGGIPSLKLRVKPEDNPIARIDIGRERGEINNWRKSISPEWNNGEFHLPSETELRKGGWFFLRLYDDDSHLLESHDFRYAPYLQKIDIPSDTLIPPADGHKETRVKIHHSPESSLEPTDESALRLVREVSDIGTILTVSADPNAERSRWKIGVENGPKVVFEIQIERLWWIVGEDGNDLSIWDSRIVQITRSDCRADSIKALFVRLPDLRQWNVIRYGFENDIRTHQLRSDDDLFKVPLRNFSHLAGKLILGRHDFRLIINSREITIAFILVRRQCRECQQMIEESSETETHIRKHLNDLLPHLSLDEMRDYMEGRMRIPVKIYKCSNPGCEEYISTEDHLNPTSAICNHCENLCRFRTGRVQFEIIDDHEVIRDQVIGNYPYVYKCSVCEELMEIPRQEEREIRRLSHLKDNHLDHLLPFQ